MTSKQKRITQAITETKAALDRALRYSFDLRDHALIDFYDTHLINLAAMLAA